MKIVIVVLGSNGSGKSTLSRELLGEAKEYYTIVAGERIKVTFGAAGIALAGNLKNGTDSVKRMVVLQRTVELLLHYCQVVIVDGFRCTYTFTDFIQQLQIHGLGALFVYFDTSLETNVSRLMSRRRITGIRENTLPVKTQSHLLRARKRAWAVFDRARQTYKREPVRFLAVNGELPPEQVGTRVREAIAEFIGQQELRKEQTDAARSLCGDHGPNARTSSTTNPRGVEGDEKQ